MMLRCNWPAVWNTFIFWLHGYLRDHKTYVMLDAPNLWTCLDCAAAKELP